MKVKNEKIENYPNCSRIDCFACFKGKCIALSVNNFMGGAELHFLQTEYGARPNF